jgi:hypothetical protein
MKGTKLLQQVGSCLVALPRSATVLPHIFHGNEGIIMVITQGADYAGQ